MYFQYDANNVPLGFIYNDTQYFYMTNLSGDVLGITEADGNFFASYQYDEWGKLISIDTADEDGATAYREIAEANPLRYRGYYYDSETGYYYLQSRYYDPEICRFINADAVEIALLTKNINVGTNLISYCNNNPVNNCDINGYITEKEAKNAINAFINNGLRKYWLSVKSSCKFDMTEIYREISGNYTAKIKYGEGVIFRKGFNITVGDYNSWKEDGKMSGQLNMEFINNQGNYIQSEYNKGHSVSFFGDGPNLLSTLLASIITFLHMLVSLIQAGTSDNKSKKVESGWIYMFEITKGNSDINGRYALYSKGGYKKI